MHKYVDEPLYYCPYKDCQTIVPNRAGNLYSHIRKKHFKDLLSRQRYGNVFYTCHDEIIDFQKGTIRIKTFIVDKILII